MSYKYRNGETPDHVDSSDSDADYPHVGVPITASDTSSDADVRKKVEGIQGKHIPGTGSTTPGSERTNRLADKAISEGLFSNNPSSAGTYKKMQASENTDADIETLDRPAKARAALAKATSDSAAAMQRLKKNNP